MGRTSITGRALAGERRVVIVEPRILIAGGSGVFGTRLAWDLITGTSCRLTLVGRSLTRLRRVARKLGGRCDVHTIDLRDPAALTEAARGHFAVACTAGPFNRLSPELPAAAVAAGAHWLDISDDREWVMRQLQDSALHLRARAVGVAVAPGLSSTPAISAVLARRCCEMLPKASTARVTLYIGNRNRKGVASIARACVSGSSEHSRVELPFGERTAFRFDSPDTPLMQEELGLEARFAVAFQAKLGYRVMAAIGRRALARPIAWATRPFGLFGDPRGCLRVDVWDAAKRRAAAWVTGHDQRMPVIPFQMTLKGLLDDDWPKCRAGVIRPWRNDALQRWLDGLRCHGLEYGEQQPTSD